jgi:hypothetical protein
MEMVQTSQRIPVPLVPRGVEVKQLVEVMVDKERRVGRLRVPHYGIATSTLYLGSGGGGPAFNGTRGGYGGGLVRVVASGALTINGGVLAKGEAGVGGNTGGGSGGSIYLSASILAGSGQIDATGGGGTGFWWIRRRRDA